MGRLEINGLSCGRGERALFSDLDLSLAAGEIVRVRGDNGSGKTTLLRTVAGLYRPLSGTITWREEAGGPAAAEWRDRLCFVGHDNALNAALTPVENLDLLLRLSGHRVDENRLDRALRDAGLARLAHRPSGRLSAGQRRRMSLLRLALSDAPLWLLDEPASALDVAARQRLGETMAGHVQAGGMILFTTHETLAPPGLSIREVELASC